jgi:hypothetical protein
MDTIYVRIVTKSQRKIKPCIYQKIIFDTSAYFRPTVFKILQYYFLFSLSFCLLLLVYDSLMKYDYNVLWKYSV